MASFYIVGDRNETVRREVSKMQTTVDKNKLLRKDSITEEVQIEKKR